MSGADWIILVVLLVSVVQAASAGFFQEACGIAGLVFGYIVGGVAVPAAGGAVLTQPEIALVGGDGGFPGYFFSGYDCGGDRRPRSPLDHERGGPQFSGPVVGRGIGFVAGLSAGGRGFDEHGGVHARLEVADRARSWRLTFWWWEEPPSGSRPANCVRVSIRVWICCTGNSSRRKVLRRRQAGPAK